jgi:hypothetical protein
MKTEEEKYYKPESGEFKDGFEYEYLEGNNRWIEDSVLSVFDPTTMELIQDSFNQGELRVKHLDKSDIEDVGWEFTGKGVADWYKIEGDFDIGNWTAYEAVMIHDSSCDWVKIHVLDRGEEVEIFQGTIKNKSVFKQVLKMIGI